LRPALSRADAPGIAGDQAKRDATAVQAEIGYMPQHFDLYEDLTVADAACRSSAGGRPGFPAFIELAGPPSRINR
jgi:hypothetical protein